MTDEEDRAAHTPGPEEAETFRKIADLLDTQFKVPGLGMRIGLDGVLGLIPVVGDTITGGLGLYALATAHRLKLPLGARLKMIWNIGVDMIIGAIPLIGDIFDFAFHAHAKNYAIIAKHLDRRARRAGR